MKLSNDNIIELKKSLNEVSNSMTRIEAERTFIKESVSHISDAFGLNKKVVNKLVKTYHKQNYQDEVNTMSEFTELYETITK
jgi:hypothetical protein